MTVRRALLLLSLVLTLSACSDDDTTGPGSVVVEGVYTLQSINGRPLPYLLVNVLNAFALHQVGGTMRLNADKTFIERDSLRWTINDEKGVPQITDTTVVFTGTWVRSDSVMELVDNRGTLLIGVINANSLTLNLVLDSVFTYVYRK